MKKYNETMRYAARRFARGVRVMAEFNLTAAQERAQALAGELRDDREALAAHALAGTGTPEELTALRDRIAANAQTLADLRGAIGAQEEQQRSRVATQFARRMDGAIADARGGYFRARIEGVAPSGDILAALSLPITTGANPGGNLLPITLSEQLLTDLYDDHGILAEVSMTQVKGLRLPVISMTDDEDDNAVPAGSDPHEIGLEDGMVMFGRYPGRDMINVPSALLRGTNTALDAYITQALQTVHRRRMLRRIFKTGAAGEYTHMSVYDASVGVKSIQAATLLDAIFAALADLPTGVRAVAKVCMTPAAWFGLVKGLTNGAATLFGKPDEAALGFAVVLCDYATTPIVGDLTTIHVNYDDPVSMATDTDIKKDVTTVVLGADYDIRIKQPECLRLIKTTA